MKDPVRVEMNLVVPADREADVERSALLHHRHEIGDPLQVAVDIDRVAITPEPEMLDRVEAGQGVSDLGPAFSHQVGLAKNDVLVSSRGQWAHVEDFDRTEGRDVGDKPVDA
ncbi:Uncharacterised protein [Mycobacterium tuberculosis]|nr:Uncharacterised protein [Mycobacterium tuberculosis]